MASANNNNSAETDHQPWDKLPEETSKAFAAFVIYLRMGPTRNLRAVCEKFYKSGRKAKGGSNMTQISKWSQSNAWVSRAAAHDAHIAMVEFQELVQARKEAVRRHLATAEKIEKLADRRLSNPKFQHTVRSARDVLAYASKAIEIERDALGIKRNDEQQPPRVHIDLCAAIKYETDRMRMRIIEGYVRDGRITQEQADILIQRGAQQPLFAPLIPSSEVVIDAVPPHPSDAACAHDPALQPAPEPPQESEPK
jgi:hypothetical protein